MPLYLGRFKYTTDSVQATNGFRNLGYDGPCPPEGSTHRYLVRLFAVDEVLNLGASATRDQVLDALKGHVLGEGRLTTTYTRSHGG